MKIKKLCKYLEIIYTYVLVHIDIYFTLFMQI